MISTKDVVVQYRPNRVIDITDQQIAYIPRLEEDQVECSMPYYVFEGRKVSLNPKTSIIFKLRYLHFNDRMNSIKRRNYRSCNESLLHLIDKKVLKPFMLFINRLFIPWEAIRIVINNEDFYLILDGSKISILRDLCRSYEFVQIFSLPENAIYINSFEEFINSQYTISFMFDSNLLYTDYYSIASYGIAINCYINRIKGNPTINATPIYNNYENIKVSERNIFLFVNGYLHYGQPQQIKRCVVNGDHLSYYHSGNVQYNVPIRVDGNLLSVNNGMRIDGTVFDVVFFKNTNYTSENLDNIMRISEASRIAAVRSSNNGTNLPYFQKLSNPFNLPIDQYMSFDSHMDQSESFIMGYNPYLYNELVKSYSTIEIQELKGSEVLKAAKKSNTLSIGLKNDGIYEERLLLFVNGILHVNHALSVVNRNTMTIPIGSTISANDAVEIMRFKNVNNSEVGIIINESDGFIYRCDVFINNSMRLFCKIPSQSKYTYPDNGFQQFEVKYTLEQDENGYAKITLADPFYYGKELTIAYKNRFVYRNFKIARNDTKVVNMGNHFKFCIDINRYMVFVNGRLLKRDQYTILIPCDAASDNYQFIINLNTALKSSDKLDIVYSSTDLEDFLLQDNIDISGDIVVDPETLDYIFSKELYMIWLNGKKIPMSQLDDINTTCIRINQDQKTTSNLRVIKYIKCDAIRNITHNGFIWDEAIFNSGMSNEEINKIIGKENIKHTNTEPNYGDKTARLVVDISHNALILSDEANVMTFAISNKAAILQDPSEQVASNIEANIFYIRYGGSN